MARSAVVHGGNYRRLSRLAAERAADDPHLFEDERISRSTIRSFGQFVKDQIAEANVPAPGRGRRKKRGGGAPSR